MSLTPGTLLGPYEILSALGAGGMGEVYRARDGKLHRDVAIKVLRPLVASDPERLARFSREAQVLASLNHPNIAHIYGLDRQEAQAGHAASATTFLVMELVDGEELAHRIARGPMPLAEALPIARQIAEALEAAHEQGVIHRDLKPANIKIRADGTVKVLDFGLAKALDPAVAQGFSPADVSMSPTITTPAMTQAGMILGTAAYMSPEQARGKPVDRRADIWSFGAVVYEILTGQRAFKGDEVSDMFAAVLRQDIDWAALPPGTPLRLRRLLERCLDRDAKQRLRDIGEARVEIAKIEAGAPDTGTGISLAPASSLSTLGARAGWIVAAVLAIAFAGAAWTNLAHGVPSNHAVWLTLDPPLGVAFDAGLADAVVVSPNGRLIVFTGRSADGKRQLWLRSLDSLNAHPLPGTEEPLQPFWSPDSRSICFSNQGKLKRIEIAGGRPQTLGDAPRLTGGTWSADGIIVFGPDFGKGLLQLPARGGAATPAMRDTGPAAGVSAPSFLPDGRHFLYTAESRVWVGSLDSLDPAPLTPGSDARYSNSGWLLFKRDGALLAQAFDPARLTLKGDPITLFAEANEGGGASNSPFSVSDNGVLVLKRPFTPEYQLVWFDRQGRQLNRVGAPIHVALPMSPRLAPDSTQVVVQNREPQPERRGIWVIDLARNVSTRLSSRSGQYPQWSPDGRRVASTWPASSSAAPQGIYQVPASGVGAEELLLKGGPESGGTFPTDWAADGRFFLYYTRGQKTGVDLWVLPLFGDRKPHPVVNTEFEERQGQISPDGRWLAYRSDRDGNFEIYVQSFSADGIVGSDRIRISQSGGGQPRFRRDGQELFYLADDGQMMAVAIKTGDAAFEHAAPKALFKTRMLARGSEPQIEYDVTRDGQRFLIGTILEGPNATPPSPIVVLDWAAELKK